MAHVNMGESDDYKRGWYDGYRAAKQTINPSPQPFMPTPINKPNIRCDKCGMVWEGAMGYVCPRQDCTIQPKITSVSNKEIL